MARRASKRLAYFTFGPFARLYSEDHFLEALKPLGISRRGLRALFRALSVPTLEIGRTRLIDHLSLVIALRSVLRVGEPDFLAPGCESLSKGRRPKASRVAADPAVVRSSIETVLAELVMAARLHTAVPFAPHKLRLSLRQAAERMLNAGLASLPLAEQDAYAARAVDQYARNPFFHLDGLAQADRAAADNAPLLDPTHPRHRNPRGRARPE